MDEQGKFKRWFEQATGKQPYPFQVRFACEPNLPQLVDVPTGMGKTAMAVLGWLWRRRFHEHEAVRTSTPRRLVYCLPMRVLVEQTRDNAVLWLHNLELLAGMAEFEEKDGSKRLRSYTQDAPHSSDPKQITVQVLMGGEDEEDWDLYPEREEIIIGTQDMVLSRALNRGYAATRSRWPIQFGLLNTDCLWIFDEVQLMGSGLATTAQLEAFRRLFPDKDSDEAKNRRGCRSVWMSATMQRDWLKTVDFAPFLETATELTFDFEREIEDDRLDEKAREALEDRWQAMKPLAKGEAAMGDAASLKNEVRQAHKPGTRTIVILNTVKRACALFDALELDANHTNSSDPEIVLLHSRFRPEDRKKQIAKALAPLKPGEPGTIVVSTQVIEAGLDVSATTLFTEVAPWASLVQRFGRCNRRGEADGFAAVRWVGLPDEEAFKRLYRNKVSGKDGKPKSAKEVKEIYQKHLRDFSLPYEIEDLVAAEKRLTELTNVGLKWLPHVPLKFEHTHVIRRKDLIDLFDTTPDLAGNDIDIDRFVRDVEDSDVRVFWRDYGDSPNETEKKEAEPAPRREELCPAPIGKFRDFAEKHAGKVWRWSFLDNRWEPVDERKIAPGQVFLVHADAGGYLAERGWDPDSKDRVDPIAPARVKGRAPDATDDDPPSRIGVWQTIAEHTDDLCREVECALNALPITQEEAAGLRHAARWHDRGKAHPVFQNAIDDGQIIERNGQMIQRRERPEQRRGCRVIAKAPDKRKNMSGQIIDQGFWQRYDWVPKEGRKHFRHELASALSVLDPRNDKIPGELRDLVAYLVAAHHGKVRLSIRSLPNERQPNGNRRFARGIWDDDKLLATDLGGGVVASEVLLTLEPMELGLCEREPFRDQPSWAERMLGLRDILGPFRLAYLEAILRAADMRASREAERREEAKQRDQESPHGKEAAS